jgi:nucleoside-diphosphate-sugar epimerase
MISEIEFALGDAYGAFEHPLVATEHDELTEEVEIGKITRDFKWSPRVSLKDAIRETVGKVGK